MRIAELRPVPNFTAASSPDLMRPHGRLGTAQLLGYLKDLQVLAFVFGVGYDAHAQSMATALLRIGGHLVDGAGGQLRDSASRPNKRV
jgi:hypothetical protein